TGNIEEGMTVHRPHVDRAQLASQYDPCCVVQLQWNLQCPLEIVCVSKRNTTHGEPAFHNRSRICGNRCVAAANNSNVIVVTQAYDVACKLRKSVEGFDRHLQTAAPELIQERVQ